MTIAANGQVTFSQTLIGTALDISGDIDVDGTTNLDIVDIDGAVNMATTALVTGVLTTTAATVFNGGFAANAGSTIAQVNNTSSLIAARYNASNRKIGFNANNSNGQGFIGSNANSVSGSANNTYDIDGKAFKIDFGNAITMDVAAAGTAGNTITYVNVADFTATGSVFNEGSADLDFRVESNGNANMLFVDGGANHVNIGTAVDLGGVLNISNADNTPQLVLYSEDADANAGPILELRRNSSSPADDDLLGSVIFVGENSADEVVTYAAIKSYALDVTNGTEDGQYNIETMVAGSLQTRLLVTSSEIALNESSIDSDFRVESNGNANMLFVDGGNNRVGMGTAAPATELHIKATSGEAELRLEAVANSEARLRFGDATDNDAGYVGYSRSGGNLNFSALNTDGEHMRINADGKVGINNTTPTKGQLVVSGAVATNETCLLSFDDFGTRGTGTAQRIDFRMGRTGQVTDNPASIVCITEGDGASTASHFNSLEFRTVGANTINNNHFKLNAGGAKIQFMTDEVPQSNNPITSVCFVIGPSASGAVTQGLTDACVLQNRSGELFAIDSSHNNTQITPHNWGLISDGASEELAWTYYSQRPNPSDNDQLQTINVDMAKVIRKVEDLVGEKLIYTENSNKDSHSFKNIIADIQTALTNLTTRITNLEG